MYWQSSLLSSQASPPVENYSLSLILQCGGFKRDSVTGKRGSTGQKVGTISAGALQRYRFKLFFCINYQIQFWILYRISLCVCNQNLIDKKNVLPSSEKSGCLLCKIAIEDLFFLSEVSHKKSRVLLFLSLAVHATLSFSVYFGQWGCN